MLDQRYPIDDVRQFLTEAGARKLSLSDSELPLILKSRSGENWLVPVGWKLTSHVIVNLSDTYPDDPPTFFLPNGYCGIPLIPHVSKAGNVCTLPPDSTVNPDKPREVLETSLHTVKSLLDREWDGDAIHAEIEPELAAYWSLDVPTSVLYFQHDLPRNILEIIPYGSDKSKFMARPASEKEFAKEIGLGLVVHLKREDAVGFLRVPEAFLLDSDAVKESVKELVKYIEPRNRVLNSIRLFLFLVFELEQGACVLNSVVTRRQARG